MLSFFKKISSFLKEVEFSEINFKQTHDSYKKNFIFSKIEKVEFTENLEFSKTVLNWPNKN